MRRAVFMAVRTECRARIGLRVVEISNQFPCLPGVCLIHDPYFGPSMVDGNFTHDALRIFVEYPCIYAGLRQQPPNEMGIGKRGCGVDFQHQSNVSTYFGMPFTSTALIPAFPKRSTATWIETI